MARTCPSAPSDHRHPHRHLLQHLLRSVHIKHIPAHFRSDLTIHLYTANLHFFLVYINSLPGYLSTVSCLPYRTYLRSFSDSPSFFLSLTNRPYHIPALSRPCVRTCHYISDSLRFFRLLVLCPTHTCKPILRIPLHLVIRTCTRTRTYVIIIIF